VQCTEDLAVRFGDIIGGLLNATFGNVVEMILSVAALQKDLFYVVATSLMSALPTPASKILPHQLRTK
jgi:Ca2+:H+ antiporter